MCIVYENCNGELYQLQKNAQVIDNFQTCACDMSVILYDMFMLYKTVSQVSEKLKMISKLEHDIFYLLKKFLVIKHTEIINGLINIFCMYDKCLAISCYTKINISAHLELFFKTT